MLTHDSLVAAVAAQSVPFPGFAVGLSTLLLALGGTSIILGLMPRIGLGLIMLFLVPVTFVMHAFWAVPDQAAKSLQLAMFMKNLALLGACFGLSAIPVPWPISLDEWLENNGHRFGGDTLVRGWQRLSAGAKRAVRRFSMRARPSTEILSAARRPGTPNPHAVVRRYAAWSNGRGVIVRSTLSYRVW
jgi:putative oxidoreductase